MLPSSNVFSLLEKSVQRGLVNFGFSEPTRTQVESIPLILKGENVLLIASTGSGKTEAALLPVFSNFIRHTEKRGISILYVTPLRALNRDMMKRLSLWAEYLGISVEVRHGDTEIKTRRQQALQPPNMLITTPETLQAILPGTLMQKHLKHVRYVIIDEVHELAEDKRGTQLMVALERLSELTEEPFQRIGLSATVSKPQRVADFIAGTHRQIKVVEVPLRKGYIYSVEHPTPSESDYELAQQLYTSPEAAARIRRMLDLVKNHTSTLIFVNSRTNAEMLGYKFGKLTKDTAVHHGSLSREERTSIEDAFKNGKLKAIVCTSTLELGIDIGNVELVIQYLSPRQVRNLIQRVGRSGHRLDRISKGLIVTAFPDDTMESLVVACLASKGKLETPNMHEYALDVLAHQVAGIVLDKGMAQVEDVLEIIRRAYPYRNLSKAKLLDVIDYLVKLRILLLEGNVLKKGKKTRKYYYENLSMIPDERRYPVVDAISDRIIGVVGDEFMSLRARIGLNIILRGNVWRIVQIEEDTGMVHVVPSEDPFAATPGWDGEMVPVPFHVAQEVGKLREKIEKEYEHEITPEPLAERLAKELSTSKSTLLKAVEEILEQIRQKAIVPTHNKILIEAFKKYIVVHSCFGDVVNRTLGCIFDSILSDHELIIGWWNDGYRILIETPRSIESYDLERLPNMLFGLTDVEVDKAFEENLKAHFPFAYKMKFVAERFGALPRGKTMAYGKLEDLPKRFEKTPVYEETLREVMLEKVDILTVKRIMQKVRRGEIKVYAQLRLEKPTPLAYHILEQFTEVTELMAPKRILLNNIERMRRTIATRKVHLLCLSCGTQVKEKHIRDILEKPICEKCGSNLLAHIRAGQDPEAIKDILKRRLDEKELTPEELEQLTYARRTADLVLSYGKKALIAFQVKGVGPDTAFRILGKMHQNMDEFYMDLLKAKIQYLRTRPYWKDKERGTSGY